MIIRNFKNGHKERQWYIEQLGFEFSGEVDTVILHTKYHGLILFHLTKGNIDRTLEDKLQEQLHYHGELRFLHLKTNDRFELFSKMAYQYLPGDSLSVNTRIKQIVVYRKGKKIYSREIMENLRESLTPASTF